jgi:hypothetical protein
MNKLKKIIILVTALSTLSFLTVPLVFANDNVQYVCDTTTFPAADDSSFQMNLPFSLKLGEIEYEQVFVSTNGVLSFGVSDATYWDYPNTPSISVAGYDWVTWGNGAYLRYGVTSNTVCIQWAVRPYPQSSGDITNIDLKIVRQPNGSWSGEVTSNGWLPDNLRRGIRYQAGEEVVAIDSTFQVGAGGIPVETKTCWNGAVIPVTETCAEEPLPTLESRTLTCDGPNPYTGVLETWQAYQRYYLYWDNHTENIDTVEEACNAYKPNFPEPLPEILNKQINCVGNSPLDNSEVRWTATQQYKLYWDGRTEDIGSATEICNSTDPNLDNVDSIIVLENGVELTVTVAEALELFESPSDLINAIFTNPGQVITAIANIGADMTREQRKQAQKALIPAVIVTQVIGATNAITLVRSTR